jgi:Uma2 family endonuclease
MVSILLPPDSRLWHGETSPYNDRKGREGAMAVEAAAETVEEAAEVRFELPERLFTIEEFERIGKSGIFGEDERVELIDGRIVQMNPIGDDHAWNVTRLSGIFWQSGGVVVHAQNPIRLGPRIAPEPDLAVLRATVRQGRKPEPADILLIIEVANTSLTYDRQIKAALYARANILEYWIVDINGERVETYRDPSPAGYRSIHLYLRGEQLAPAFKPDLRIDVDAILGPPAEES